jgi:hypothetical protein
MACHNIDCFAINASLKFRWYDIDIGGRVWPCCNYANVWGDPRGDYDYNMMQNDTHLYELFQKDPDWNSLHHHTMEEIISHPVFTEYVWHSGWSSDSPPPLCVESCSVNR